MQNPVIQRIKHRAEVCQSLPVTCGRRGNDTGNGMVTVISLRCAVDCFPENGKSPHSKPFTFLLLPTAKCRSGMFFTLCPPQLCHRVEKVGSFDLHHFGIAGAQFGKDHANLPQFIRELANWWSHAASALIHKKTRGARLHPSFQFREKKGCGFFELLLTQPSRTPIRALSRPRLTGHHLLIHSLSMALQTSGFSFREHSRHRTPSLGEQWFSLQKRRGLPHWLY